MRRISTLLCTCAVLVAVFAPPAQAHTLTCANTNARAKAFIDSMKKYLQSASPGVVTGGITGCTPQRLKPHRVTRTYVLNIPDHPDPATGKPRSVRCSGSFNVFTFSHTGPLQAIGNPGNRCVPA